MARHPYRSDHLHHSSSAQCWGDGTQGIDPRRGLCAGQHHQRPGHGLRHPAPGQHRRSARPHLADCRRGGLDCCRLAPHQLRRRAAGVCLCLGAAGALRPHHRSHRDPRPHDRDPDRGRRFHGGLDRTVAGAGRQGAQDYPGSVVAQHCRTDARRPGTDRPRPEGGWGVGGIEAEAAMLGQPSSMLIPAVVGFKLHGRLPEGATATDLVLTVTEMLRKKGVVGKFVEFYGTGLSSLSLPDRATIANMAPEYGATMGFFPVDAETLAYLRSTGRDPQLVRLVEAYTKEQGLFRTDQTPDPLFSDTLPLDLATVEPTLAGPKRPQDRVPLREAKASFLKVVEGAPEKHIAVQNNGDRFELSSGA